MTVKETARLAAIKRKDRYYQEIYMQGARSTLGAKNPHSQASEIRAFCAWQGGLVDSLSW